MPAFPGEIFEHIFTSILRARLCRMQIAAAVSRDVWPRMGGAQYPLMVRAIQLTTIRCNIRRDNILLYKWHPPPSFPERGLAARTYYARLSLFDFRKSNKIVPLLTEAELGANIKTHVCASKTTVYRQNSSAGRTKKKNLSHLFRGSKPHGFLAFLR